MSKTEGKPDFVAAFEAAGVGELEAVRKEISILDTRLASLRVIETALATKVYGPPPKKEKKPKQPKQQAASSGPPPAVTGGLLDERRKKCLRHLRVKGPLSMTKLSDETGIARHGPNCLGIVIACDWFHTNDDGVVSLSSAGDRVVL